MANVGYATLTVIPEISGITEKMSGALGGASKIGESAGRSLGAGIAAGVDASKALVQKAADDVAKATEATAKAREKEANAADQVKVAEAQLSTLREKGTTDAGKLAAAEAKVEKAKRAHDTASRAVEQSVKAEAAAAEKLVKVEERVAKSSDAAATSAGKFGGKLAGLKSQLAGVGAGGKHLDGLTSKVKGLGSTITAGLGFGAGMGIVGVTKSLIEMGDTFAQVNKKLSFATGATGTELEKLNQSVKNIGKSSPKALEDIADAMGDVAKATQLTGQPLEDVTKRMIKLDTMGVDANIEGLTQAMRAFGVPANQMASQMDDLYRASRSSGMGMQELSDLALKGAPQFKQFGFSLNDTANMMGNLHRAGVRGEAITIGLNKAMIALSKGGGDVKVKLKDSVAEIDKLVKAGNTAGATEMASKLFGTKSAGQFVEAVKQGKLNVDQLTGSLDKQKNGILDTGGGVVTMSGAWQMLKNNVMIVLEPIVKSLFTALTDGIMWIRTHGVNAIQSLSDKFGFLSGIMKPMKELVAPIAAALASMGGAILVVVTATKIWTIVQGAFNTVMAMNPITLVVIALVGLGAALVVAYKKSETFRNIVNGAWKAIKGTVSGVVNWFKDTAWPLIKGFFEKVGEIAGKAVGWIRDHWRLVISVIGGPIGIVVALVTKYWGQIKTVISVVINVVKAYIQGWIAVIKGIGAVTMWLWRNAIMPAWNGIKVVIGVVVNVVKGYINAWMAIFRAVGAVAMWLWRNVIVPAWDGIKLAISTAVDAIGTIIEKVKGFFQSVADKAGEVKDWIVDKWNAVVDFFSGVKDKISNVAKGMWDGVKDAFKSVINWIIRAWNSLEFKVPSATIMGKKIGGFTLSVPKIQELATGGTIAHRDRRGLLSGPGTGTSDSILGVNAFGMPIVRVSAGEGVVNERAMLGGGAPVVAALNSGWVPSPSFLAGMDGLQALASGGTIGYGLPTGTNIGYGGSGFPDWIVKIGQQHDVKPSTYPGHQESDRGEAGYAANPQHLNRGIDWSGTVEAMQKFAEWLLSIAPLSTGLEQIIWMNPGTGQKIGWAGRSDVSGSGYYASDYGGHTDHVHTRQAAEWPTEASQPDPAATPDPSATNPATPDPSTVSPAPDVTTTPTEPERKSIGTSLSEVAGSFVSGQLQSLFGVIGLNDSPPWLDAYDKTQQNLKRPGDDTKGLSAADSKKLREAEDKVSDKAAALKLAQAKLDEVDKDPKAKPSQKLAAQQRVDQAEREAKQAEADLAALKAKTSPAAPPTSGATTTPDQQTPTTPTPDDPGTTTAAPTFPTNTPEGNIADGKPGVKAAFWKEWGNYPGWQAGDQWLDTLRLFNGESGWDNEAQNPGSTAYGTAQFLDTTWAGVGETKSSDPAVQARAAGKYLKGRSDYGSPSAAWKLWNSRNPHWYEQGGWLPEGLTLTANGTGGPEPILAREQWADAHDAIKIVQRQAEEPGNRGHGTQVNYHIQTARVEDAFLAAQQAERRRAATRMAGV